MILVLFSNLFEEPLKVWYFKFNSRSAVPLERLTCILLLCSQSQTAVLAEKEKVVREQNVQLKAQIAQLGKYEQDQKAQLQEYIKKVQLLEVGIRKLVTIINYVIFLIY